MTICGAKKKDGTPCRMSPMPNGRCRLHGGKSLAGIASPLFKDGRYSRFLPARLGPRYDEARADGELLALREDIALTDARLGDLLSRVDTGESGALWRSLMAAREDLLARRKAGDTVGQIAALNQIVELIAEGHADYRAWGEVAAVLDQRRRLVESERKRLVEMQQMISSERMMVLLGAVVGVIQEHVRDRAILSGITTGIQKLITADPDA
jgi:hypothetical protein